MHYLEALEVAREKLKKDDLELDRLRIMKKELYVLIGCPAQYFSRGDIERILRENEGKMPSEEERYAPKPIGFEPLSQDRIDEIKATFEQLRKEQPDNSKCLRTIRGQIMAPDFPSVVTLCGSTRFKDEFLRVQKEETLKGKIVLSVGLFGHSEALDMNGPIKAMLDNLHLRKIDMSNEVIFINQGGYIGESTRRELEYTKAKGIPYSFTEPPVSKNPCAELY